MRYSPRATSIRATETARSRLCASADSISAASRGSGKKSRQPMSTARVPTLAPALASYATGAGNAGRECCGAKLHAVSASGSAAVTDNRRPTTQNRSLSMRCTRRDLVSAIMPMVLRDLFRCRWTLAADPAAHRQIEQRDEEDSEQRRREHAPRDARTDGDAARRARA